MKTILVPTDFSVPANNALNYAVNIAGVASARLVLLNVYSLNIANEEIANGSTLVAEARKRSLEALEEQKKRISDNGFTGEIVCISEIGLAKEIIKEVATNYNVYAIVMGITGEAGILKEKVIGSTTLDIAREIHAPLFIIPENYTYNEVNKISYSCDIFNLQGSGSLESVKHFSKLFQAKLEIVNLEKPSAEDPPIRIRNINFMNSILDDVKYELIVLNGESNGPDKLANYFENSETDLIVLNPKKHNFIQTIFHKSMTKMMVFHSKIPVLIVH